jgi:hypothetical protein
MVLNRIFWLNGLVCLLLSACQPTSQPLPPAAPPPVQAPATAAPAALENPAPIGPAPTLAPTRPVQAPFAQLATPTAYLPAFLNPPETINPLTGLPADPANLNRRPVMIKVSNFPRVGRPHAGLSLADLVFEYYIGEDVNRFLAVYYGQNSPKVGPIRSGRLVDAQLANFYQGTLVYGNADPQVDTILAAELKERAVATNDYPCPPICGTDTHSIAGVFADSQKITEYSITQGVQNIRPKLAGFAFDERTPWSDQFAINIGVEYANINRGEWRYDPQSRSYLRWIEDENPDGKISMIPLLDRNNSQQLSFANVIIMFAIYIEYKPTLHDIIIRESQDGGGKAVLFRDGEMLTGSWKVMGKDRPLQFVDRWGLPLSLKPGNTWIVIAGTRSKFEQAAPGHWEMKFDLP